MRFSYRAKHGYQERDGGAENISNTLSKDKIAGSQPWLCTGTNGGASQNPEAWVSLIHSDEISLGDSYTSQG